MKVREFFTVMFWKNKHVVYSGDSIVEASTAWDPGTVLGKAASQIESYQAALKQADRARKSWYDRTGFLFTDE